MYDALNEGFEMKRGNFLNDLTGSLDVNKWKVDDEDEEMVLL